MKEVPHKPTSVVGKSLVCKNCKVRFTIESWDRMEEGPPFIEGQPIYIAVLCPCCHKKVLFSDNPESP